METPDEQPLQQTPAHEDHTLEDLAALTGLFNLEVAWHNIEVLDQLDEAQKRHESHLPEPEPDKSFAASEQQLIEEQLRKDEQAEADAAGPMDEPKPHGKDYPQE
jgi:hypothetical protein